MSETKWINSFFGGERDFYGNVYREMRIFDGKDVEEEIDGVIAILKPELGSHILDWCGGWGRHAVPLAKRGFRMTILDFCPQYLERAAEYAKREGVEVELVQADFRKTPESIQADYAVNLFTAGLGYLGEANDILALQSLRRALKPEAKILLDTISLFWIARNFTDRSWLESPDGKKRHLQRRTADFWTNTVTESQIYQDLDSGTEEVQGIELKWYSPADLSRILRIAGFKPFDLRGGLDCSEFNFASRRVVVAAQS